MKNKLAMKTVRRSLKLLQITHQFARRYLKNLVWPPYLQQLTATGVVILWTTGKGENPAVEYFTDSGDRFISRGHSRTLEALNLQLHRVELNRLQPNTTYAYKIYLGDKALSSETTFSFQTAPPPGSNIPFTFIVLGDYGNSTPSQRQLRHQIARDSFDFILTTGDNSQGEGTYQQFNYKVFDVYRDIFSRAALFPALGNHDYMTGNAAPYLDLFDLPGNAWRDEDKKRYYSFDYGNTHFTVIDSNLPLDVDDAIADDDMFDWLRHDLGETTQPWKIVVCHHPPYNAGSHGSDERVQKKLVPIFETYGVDLLLSGHQHNYQRSKPLRDGGVTTVEEGGIVYVVSGAGAAAKHACNGAHWLACSVSSVNYGVYNRISVQSNSLTLETVDDQGKIRDTYTLRK